MTEKIKILYMAAWGDVTGGGPVSLLNLIKHLDRNIYVPLVVCPSQGSLVDSLEAINVKVKIIKTGPLKKLKLVSFVRATVTLLKLIKKEKISIVHSNVGASRESIYSGLAARIMRIPFVYHARVIESAGFIDRIVAGLSTRIIVISDAVKKKYRWIRDNAKIIKIYNGVDLREFHPEVRGDKIRSEFKINSETAVIGIIGNLIPWKGHEYFLAAAREIRHKREAKFIIVGEDLSANMQYRKKLEEMARDFEINRDVTFTGFRGDISNVMAALDVFVLSSLGEPFGRVLIEAMASGKPVVATRDGGVPEIVEDMKTGLLVPVKDSNAMAEAIIDLIDHKEKAQEMGLRGRTRVKDFFDISMNVKQTENLYHCLLGGEER
jgi:glycosyltransferase involved in cell wall biosynthesis